MDKNLNYAEHLENTLKKASARVKLLSRIRQNINPSTAETIYKMMILPVMLYCNNVYLNLSITNQQKFERIQNLALRIINGQQRSVKLPNVNEIRKINCAREVFKCLNDIAPMAFHNYFTRVSHSKCTRGNNKNIAIPKIRTEAGKKTFAYQGAIIFNKLSSDLKTEQSLLRFKHNCNNFNFDF